MRIRFEMSVNFASRKDFRTFEVYKGLPKLACHTYIQMRNSKGIPAFLFRFFRLEVIILWL
jgi:hypothetical protein